MLAIFNKKSLCCMKKKPKKLQSSFGQNFIGLNCASFSWLQINSHGNWMQLKLPSWKTETLWPDKNLFQYFPRISYLRPQPPETHLDYNAALHAWMWQQLYSSSRIGWAVIISNWSFAHGKSNTFLLSSSKWIYS